MLIYPDRTSGPIPVYNYWAMPFPVQLTGPITVTWDWRFFPTNGTYPFPTDVIPADYDPTNNNYNMTCTQPSWAASSWYPSRREASSHNVPWYPGYTTNADSSDGHQ